MALTKTTPKFEDADTTVVEADAPAPAPAAETSAAVPTEAAVIEADGAVVAASEYKAPAVVVQNNSAMALALRKPTGLDSAQGVIGIEELETMGIGTFPRITVDQSGFSIDKTKFAGSWIRVELLSWNYVTLVTTAEKDDKEADKLIRSSYDGVHIAGTKDLVTDYLANLRKDYPDATTKKYVEIYAMLLDSDKLGPTGDSAGIHQLSVSPQSIKKWQNFLLTSRVHAFRGKEPNTTFDIASQRVVNGNNIYGVMVFGQKSA